MGRPRPPPPSTDTSTDSDIADDSRINGGSADGTVLVDGKTVTAARGLDRIAGGYGSYSATRVHGPPG